MQIHDLIQGSPEWLAYRREYQNASDAPAMMGLSPYKTRSALIQEMATGVTEEITPEKQRLFNNGHRTEALARPHAEKMAGVEFYPIVASNGKLSASFDGISMDGRMAFEHKMLNNDIRAALADPDATGADLPMVYQIQMEQQCMVAETCERVLFLATKFSPAGELMEERSCWYTPNPALAAKIAAGWAQAEADAAAYKPEAKVAEVKPVARAIEALPALIVQVEGRVVTTNLKDFRAAASVFIAGIKTDLETDQDFADAETTVKFCEDGEKRLELVKQQALGQTASIEELFNTIDAIREDLRAKRLTLEKAVTARKASIRTEIITKAQQDIDAHWTAIGDRLNESWIKRACPDFAAAMKGKRTVATCRDAVAQALASAKVDMTQQADLLEANRKTLHRDGKDWYFLFRDFSIVGLKPAEDFAAIAALRIREHQDELKRDDDLKRERISTRMQDLQAAMTTHADKLSVDIDAERLRIEANKPTMDLYGDRLAEAVELRTNVLATLLAQATAARLRENPAGETSPPPAIAPAPATTFVSVQARRRSDADSPVPTLSISEMNTRLGVVLISERGLSELGYAAVIERGFKLYHEADWPTICRALKARIDKAATMGMANTEALEPAL